jgi:hypothetical protein
MTGVLTGCQFDRWTVVAFSRRTSWRTDKYSCLCACGKTGVVDSHELRRAKGPFNRRFIP